MVKNPLAVQEMRFDPCARKIPWEKEMAAHSSIFVWEIPWTEETGRLQSMGSQRDGYGLATEHACTAITIDSMMEEA